MVGTHRDVIRPELLFDFHQHAACRRTSSSAMVQERGTPGGSELPDLPGNLCGTAPDILRRGNREAAVENRTEDRHAVELGRGVLTVVSPKRA